MEEVRILDWKENLSKHDRLREAQDEMERLVQEFAARASQVVMALMKSGDMIHGAEKL